MAPEVQGAIITSVVALAVGIISAAAAVWSVLYSRSLRSEARLALAQPRLEAYQELWSIMEPAAPSARMEHPATDAAEETNAVAKALTREERQSMERALRGWYFGGGNGIFLSERGRRLYSEAVGFLRDDSRDGAEATREIVVALSRLRSRTKNELGVYGRWTE